MRSQNGWPVLTSRNTRRWDVPGTERGFTLQGGNAGFLLTWFATWFHQNVERIDHGVWDEWGWAPRDIRGSDTVSNHASGTAIDINATKHPMGVRNTFSFRKRVKIRWCLRVRMRGAIRWGGDYRGRKDDMHFEINRRPGRIDKLATRLRRRSKIGKRVARQNR